MAPPLRAKRNIQIAQFYAQVYIDAAKLKTLYTWFDYPGVADGATTANWLMEQLNHTKPRPSLHDANVMAAELDAYRRIMADYPPIPGKLVDHAWDEGVTFSTVFEGHLADGQTIEVWEVNTLFIDDDGRITHWEFWKDNDAQDILFQKAFGKRVLGDSGLMHLTGMSYDAYVATIKAGSER